MNRNIYKFYCYNCNTLNFDDHSFLLDITSNQINQVFCPHCNSWVHYSNTNLSQNRFKIIRKDKWTIIDEDALNPTSILTFEDYTVASNICEQLNLDTNLCAHYKRVQSIFDTIKWYSNL